MEIVLLLGADQDLQAAYEWVSRYREGRGDEFLADLDKGFDYLRQFSRVGKVQRGRYRRLLVFSKRTLSEENSIGLPWFALRRSFSIRFTRAWTLAFLSVADPFGNR
jgi:hypothetical protein